MPEKTKRYSLENPQMQEMWKNKTYQSLKSGYKNGYEDFYDWGSFLEAHFSSLFMLYSDLLKNLSIDDIVNDITDFSPILDEMINLWYYDPIKSTEFYLDNVSRIISDYDEQKHVFESRYKIKRILRETTDKHEKYINLIVDYMIDKTYKEMGKTRTDLLNYWDRVIVDARKMFGFTTNASFARIENEVFDRWISIMTGLPKRGRRVRLIFMDDKYTNLKKGDEGTVVGFNNSPDGWQIRVKWDNGSNLDLIPKIDKYEVLS